MSDGSDLSEQADCVAGRFVILTHDHPFLHWDLMLEWDGVLRSWRLLAEPVPGSIIAAQPLPDHRLHYLDYEGPVSGGRGTVARWDHGRHATKQTSTPALVVTIHSDRFGNGQIELTPGSDDCPWTFLYTPASRGCHSFETS